ncbi:MAG: O-acetylhomoserine aminocarboxypropyltransferase/cysteine synthase [Planctomycetaceae bacterium]|jgi:O-acetylhomoserine (thiol)-lyase|nr:O-acetylhomoserine aminocarboxypropyltransferase/cysteine synthase [Planctomycetaceae bacterium]
MSKNYRLETLAIHAGQEIEPTTLARAVPVYRTTAYNFKSSEHGANLFALKELGNIYSRLMNPTNEVLEKRIAALEGGAAGLSLASGTAAIYFSITNILKEGDEFVSASNLYGGTYTQFDAILPQGGITARFTPVNDFKAVEAAINSKTRAVFIETIGNPVLDVADIEGYAKIAKKHHLPLIVDSTFTPPTLLRPIEHGANIVIHSLSKWIGGHGTGIGGIVIDDGKFDWTDPKFTLYNEPDRGYHGLRFAHDLGPLSPLAFILRLRTVGLRNQGPTLAPDAAWLFLQGVESLPLRAARHSENALKVAEHLKKSGKVAWIRYPGLKDDPAHKLAQKYLPNGQGGMVVFGLRDDKDGKKAVKFVDNIKLFSLLANVGDAKSLIIHSSSTTHSQLSEKDQSASGLHNDLIRLSIGLEHVDDIIEALDDALKLV